MSWIFSKLAKPFSRSSIGSDRRWLDEPLLEHLEECIAKLRAADPEQRAVALDGLAYIAGEVMDIGAQEWEDIVGRKWERYTD